MPQRLTKIIQKNDALKTPYIFHLQRTARLVQLSGGKEEEIAAAWLHDTIEDVGVTLEHIKKEFGDVVAEIVDGLTDLPEWNDLPYMERKSAQAERISKESDSIRRVKLADQISGGELDARNTLIDIETRRQKIEGVIKVAEECKGVSEILDTLFDEMIIEVKWYLEHSK